MTLCRHRDSAQEALELVAIEVLRELESEVTAPMTIGEDPDRRRLIERAATRLRRALAPCRLVPDTAA